MTDAIVSCSETSISPERYGHKAAGICWLDDRGFDVPDSVFLKATTPANSGWIDGVTDELRAALTKFETDDGTYDIAIRSSATCEDTTDESLAGHFESFIGTFSFEHVVDNVREVITSLEIIDDDSCEMGVVLQERIEPSYSGVAFSTHPVTRNRSEVVLGITEGTGEGLVAGEVGGEDVVVRKERGELSIPSMSFDVPEPILHELFEGTKQIERDAGYPVDIEWCLEAETDDLKFLQCRPATGISLDDPALVPIGLQNESTIPPYIAEHEKVASRLTAESNEVFVTDSYAAIVDCRDENPRLPDFSQLSASEKCESYTCVLVHPETVDGDVQRAFLPSSTHDPEKYRGDDRFRIVSAPEYTDIGRFVSETATPCCGEYWNVAFVVQEIYDANYTGVVKQLPERDYLIEIGYGHFIPKGVVATSRYLLSADKELVEVEERHQRKQFHIRDGHVLEEPFDDSRLIRYPEESLPDIVDEYAPFLEPGETTVEFGVVDTEGALRPFLIDRFSESSSRALDTDTASKGIISPGRITGEIVQIDLDDVEDSLHAHLHDRIDDSTDGERNVLIYAERPDISLLNLLEQHPAENVGFLFEYGSILSHFSIVLREREIPAVLIPEDGEIHLEGRAHLDTNADRENMLEYE